MLSNLVYVSVRKSNCTQEEIQKILDACKRNNGDIDTTGVLLYSDTHFIQYLEGEYKTILGLYDKIKQDDRHKNVVLITTGQIENRLFPSWQMGAKKINQDKIQFETSLSKEEANEFNQILGGKENSKAISLMQKFFN